MNENIKPSYTTIQHAPRIKFGLTNNDYCIAALIYHMSNNPYAPIKGWCTAGKETIGGYFGISRQSVHSIVAKLEEKGLVERQTQTGFLKTSGVWYKEFECFTVCKESLQVVKIEGDNATGTSQSTENSVKNLDTDCKESLHNKDTIITTNTIQNNLIQIAALPSDNSDAKTVETPKPKKLTPEEYFLIIFNEITGKRHRILCDKSTRQLKKLIKKGYTSADFKLAIENCSKTPYHIETGYQYLTPEFITRADKLEMYLNKVNAEVLRAQEGTVDNPKSVSNLKEYFEEYGELTEEAKREMGIL